MELQRDWDGLGLSERVSEVNLIDVRDIRAQLAGDYSQIEVRLGSQDQGKRLKDALDVLDGQRQTSRGSLISYIDMSQGKRAIVGLASGVHTTSDATAPLPLSTEAGGEKKSGREASLNGVRARVRGEAPRTFENKTKKERRDKASKAEKKPEKSKDSSRRRKH
jgi:hypothetical protein